MGAQYFWTRVQTPDHLLQQLLPREDNQIGFQELLGVVLALGTFARSLAGCLWLSFGDNDGVLFALKKGNGRSPRLTLLLVKFGSLLLTWIAICGMPE